MTTLYHYSCDHGASEIAREGYVRSLWDVLGGEEGDGMTLIRLPQCQFGWFTDLDVADVRGLGLTRLMLSCDRTKHRFRVTDRRRVTRWLDVRRYHPALWPLEEAPGALPAHWWLATEPVPVVSA